MAGEGTHALLVDIRLRCLPAKSAGPRLFRCQIPDLVEFSGNAIAVGIVRVMKGLQFFDGDGFQQAHSDHLRCYPG